MQVYVVICESYSCGEPTTDIEAVCLTEELASQYIQEHRSSRRPLASWDWREFDVVDSPTKTKETENEKGQKR